MFEGPQFTWLPVMIDDEEPTYLAVALSGPPPADLSRGDLIWFRGVLRTEHAPGARHGLPYVLVHHLERLRRGPPPTANGAAAGGGEPRT